MRILIIFYNGGDIWKENSICILYSDSIKISKYLSSIEKSERKKKSPVVFLRKNKFLAIHVHAYFTLNRISEYSGVLGIVIYQILSTKQ